MILHTIIDEAAVFGNAAEDSGAQMLTKKVNGGLVQMTKHNGGYRMERLFSTDPAMYLKKEYQPYATFPPGNEK